MKRAVITGATSMLGLALVQECVQNGTRVLAFVQPGSAKTHMLPRTPLLEVVECALEDYACWQAAKGQTGFEVFYHFAWMATQNASRNDVAAQQRNIGYTLDALALAQRLGCRRFVGAGSQAEYGRVTGSISEETRVAPDSAYGVAKHAAGRLCSIVADQLGIECVWTRIFSTYGPNDMPSTMIMYCIGALLDKEPPQLTACEQQWDYLYCADAAHAFYLLGTKGEAGGVYNIGGGVARPLLEYVTALRDAIDPAFTLGIGARAYADKQVMHLCANIGRLQRDTGFSPTTPFKTGIRETIQWVQNQKEVQGG